MMYELNFYKFGREIVKYVQESRGTRNEELTAGDDQQQFTRPGHTLKD
jgi:hypothetical protein